jgi:hypothetical protein
MIRKITILAIALVLSIASLLVGETGQYYFQFKVQSLEEMNLLSKAISIDNVKGDTVYAYANDKQFEKFKTLGYAYKILPNPGDLIVPEMAKSLKDVAAWDVYPTYEQYVTMMNNFAANYPSICTIQNIGGTVQGRSMLVAKISDNVNTEEDEPEVLYASSIHGDETTGYVTMLRLIDTLLTSYGTNPRITNMIDNMEIYICPLHNPDGTYHGGNASVSGAWRGNANGVDMNRNFPDPADGPHPDGNAWQVETQAMMNFASNHNFVISANFHGGVEVLNYPWDTWSRLHPDDSWWQHVCRDYADTVHLYAPSGYLDYLNNGITNGYAWYRITGGRQDYMTYFRHGRELTIEISDVKLVPASQLPAHWNYNRISLLNWLQESLYGVRGIVTSASTGLPLGVFITVVSHDADSSQIYNDPDIGDYHRMLATGTYSLKFEAPGYVTQTISGIVVTHKNATVVNVQMQPNSPYPVLQFQSHNAPALIVPGGGASMNVTLLNNGGNNATSAVGVLTTADSYITVTQNTSAYPTIAAFGGVGTSLSAYSFTVSPSCPSSHQVDFRLHLTASGGYADSVQFSLTVGLPIDNFESGGFLSYPWQMGGTLPWVVVNTGAYEGAYAARSGAITHSQTSKLSIAVQVSSPGTLSFYYKVSSEASWDALKFSIDGVKKNEWSGEVAWTQTSYAIAAGTHTFLWSYEKDGSMSSGADKAWIDLVSFPPMNSPLDITTQTLPDGKAGVAYSQQLNAVGGKAPYTWSDLNGDLGSTGLTLSSSGLLSGTPTTPGQIDFTARAQDQQSSSADKAFSFYILMCGDADGDAMVNITDATYLINYIFGGGSEPNPLAAGDVDCNGMINISDAVYLITYIFSGGPQPCNACK